jgi:hypothetical protein
VKQFGAYEQSYHIPGPGQLLIDPAPVIWLHDDDPYFPSSISEHILRTSPRINFKHINDAIPLPTVDNLSLLNKYGDEGRDVFLAGVEDVTTFPDWIFGEAPDANGLLHNATACAIVTVDHIIKNKQAVVDVFYFYFYSWNE